MATCKLSKSAPRRIKFVNPLISLQRYLDIAATSDELSERILRGPNEFSRVGRSRAQQHEGEDEAPPTGATKEEVVALLETLSALH